MAMNPAWSCQHFGVGWTRTRQERKKNNNKGSEDGDGCRVGRRMVLLRPLSLLLHAALVSLQAFFTLLTARRLFLFLSWEGEQEEGHSPAEGETLGLGDAWALLQNLCLVSGFCLHHSATRPSVVLSLSTTAEWADTYYKIAYAAGTNVAIVVRRRKKKFGCKKKNPEKTSFPALHAILAASPALLLLEPGLGLIPGPLPPGTALGAPPVQLAGAPGQLRGHGPAGPHGNQTRLPQGLSWAAVRGRAQSSLGS